MNKKDLEYFAQVYKEKSIHQVSKSLFITPQRLSRVIKNLEVEFYITLFLCSRNGVIPTKSGDFLYKKAEHMINEFCEIQTGVKKLDHENFN